MSLFSIYCGLIYNEFFSVPFHIFGGSAYKCRDATRSDVRSVGLIKYGGPYPFGVDPSWRGSRTELPFLNSLKMKMSILFGVVQMNLGMILSYFNARFFNNSLDIKYQFIPQMIFLNSLFGYLSLLIVVKWCTGSKADLYHVRIYMFLSPFDDIRENKLIWGQSTLQVILLLCALVAVPWMLFPKPFILKRRHTERFQGRTYGILRTSETDIEESVSAKLLEAYKKLEQVKTIEHEMELVLAATKQRDEDLLKLHSDLEKQPKLAPRKSYIEWIKEITKNSRKQDIDVERILKETRELQLDSNSIQERLYRTYAVVDETVFREAKKDHGKQQLYRLLAIIHENFEHIPEQIS